MAPTSPESFRGRRPWRPSVRPSVRASSVQFGFPTSMARDGTANKFELQARRRRRGRRRRSGTKHSIKADCEGREGERKMQQEQCYWNAFGKALCSRPSASYQMDGLRAFLHTGQSVSGFGAGFFCPVRQTLHMENVLAWSPGNFPAIHPSSNTS